MFKSYFLLEQFLVLLSELRVFKELIRQRALRVLLIRTILYKRCDIFRCEWPFMNHKQRYEMVFEVSCYKLMHRLEA